MSRYFYGKRKDLNQEEKKWIHLEDKNTFFYQYLVKMYSRKSCTWSPPMKFGVISMTCMGGLFLMMMCIARGG
jgi:hypothetical protein